MWVVLSRHEGIWVVLFHPAMAFLEGITPQKSIYIHVYIYTHIHTYKLKCTYIIPAQDPKQTFFYVNGPSTSP